MSNDKLAQFANQKYINLETYRKSGAAVRTPVWFAEYEGVFYIYTLADAGKVKRIRNNSRVRVVPCNVRGTVTGEWVEAQAWIQDFEGARRGHKLLNQKYGWMKKLGDFFSKLRKRERAVIAIQID